MAAIHGDSPEVTPVWFMRQAGRLFPEYRQLREKYDFKQLCSSPSLNAKVTCLPVFKLGVDAAIIFSDILLPLESLGPEFEFVSGEGPVLHQTVDTIRKIKRLDDGSPKGDLEAIYDAIRRSLDQLPDDVPLIGFGGAPFTLASYLIEGGRSRDHLKTRQFMMNQPDAWAILMEKLVNVTIPHLEGQVEAGAEILQLFDSWVGQVSPTAYRDCVLPYTRAIFQELSGVPLIHFGTKTAGLLRHIKQCGPDVISLDWRIELSEASRRLQDEVPLQGNLDPALLLSDFDRIRPHVDAILEQAPAAGHLFNLGHGILPQTEPDRVKKLVEYVHGSGHG